MARCCGGATCGCLIQASSRISVTGIGSAQDPYVIAGDVALSVVDNSVFNLTLTGGGTESSPWILSLAYASTAKLDDLPDVNAPAPSNGQVLGWDTTTSKWTNRAPTTASAGSVVTDTSLTGDGSIGTPLGVDEDPAGFITTTASGIALTTAAQAGLIQKFTDAVARAAALPTPVLNQVTMRTDNPGVEEFWNGSSWQTVSNGITRDFAPEMLALSGAYVDGMLIQLVTRQVDVTTDGDGSFDVLDATDLSDAAGVLSAWFQETGTIPYKAMVFADIDHISAMAYRLDTGAAYPNQAITGILTAYTY